jgi:hypothetical protein
MIVISSAGEPHRDEHEVAADDAHGRLRSEVRGYTGDVDTRQREDERNHGQHERQDVEREEGVERRTQHVIRVVVRAVAEHAKPQQQPANRTSSSEQEGCAEQRCPHHERDPVVAEPRSADPLHVAVLPRENPSEHGLRDHKRRERNREDVWHLHLRLHHSPLHFFCSSTAQRVCKE